MIMEKVTNGLWHNIALIVIALCVGLIGFYFGGQTIMNKVDTIQLSTINVRNANDIQDIKIEMQSNSIAELKAMVKETNDKLSETNKALNAVIIEIRRK